MQSVFQFVPVRGRFTELIGDEQFRNRIGERHLLGTRDNCSPLALCRPVLGYDHGGVGELLADLYPVGRVAPGDRARLVERAAELLHRAPAIAPLQRYRLEDMQRATLALYDELASA